jgi:hypothetical protein
MMVIGTYYKTRLRMTPTTMCARVTIAGQRSAFSRQHPNQQGGGRCDVNRSHQSGVDGRRMVLASPSQNKKVR